MSVANRTTDFPERTGKGVYSRVASEANLVDDPPAGLIFHETAELRE